MFLLTPLLLPSHLHSHILTPLNTQSALSNQLSDPRFPSPYSLLLHLHPVLFLPLNAHPHSHSIRIISEITPISKSTIRQSLPHSSKPQQLPRLPYPPSVPHILPQNQPHHPPSPLLSLHLSNPSSHHNSHPRTTSHTPPYLTHNPADVTSLLNQVYTFLQYHQAQQNQKNLPKNDHPSGKT